MDRLERILEGLKTFALTRPVMYGAPAAAIIGSLAGLAMQTGPQDAPFSPQMEASQPMVETMAEATAWPAGKVPDYVVGTDFVTSTRMPPPIQVADYKDYAPPAPDPALYAWPERPAPVQVAANDVSAGGDTHRWASDRGDILDVSLPEDARPAATPLVMVDAAPTR